ncbi:MAG TPA: hypothetical protein VFR09_00545, partial [Alphaproteobacteria bacterium]|nr:hypothetical protein [Alphaproteobacteria bacterium]
DHFSGRLLTHVPTGFFSLAEHSHQERVLHLTYGPRNTQVKVGDEWIELANGALTGMREGVPHRSPNYHGPKVWICFTPKT